MFSWRQAVTAANLFLLNTVASQARPDDTPSLFPASEFWAEIAGLMVTLPGRNPEKQEAASARHVIVVNEYRTDQLIRQSSAVRESDSPEDMLSGLEMLIRVPEMEEIEGNLNISSMHEIADAYRTSNQLEIDDVRRSLRETMSVHFISATEFRQFSFFFQSDRRVSRIISNIRRAHPQEWTCQRARDPTVGVKDCLWTPQNRGKRRILPYAWNGGQSLSDEVWKKKT